MSENPYDSPEVPTEAAKHFSRLSMFGTAVVAVAIVGLLIALMLPAVRSAREPARRNQCQSNVKQIALALHEYEADYGTLPPAYTVDAEGNRLHSWRALILPYIEETELFEAIDFSKPWDDPANATARESFVAAYYCPSATHVDGRTTYLAIVGPECAFSDSKPRNRSDVKDDQSKTIALVDVHSDQAVHWMSPQDITAEELLGLSPDWHTHHPGVTIAGFLDGHATPIPLAMDRGALRAMTTIAGGEALDVSAGSLER